MNTTAHHRGRHLRRIGATLAVGTLAFAACSSDDGDTAAPETTEATAETMGAFGPACDAVPADGEGSFSGMADDTAATAASNNPLLSTLVGAVGEADLVDTLNSDGPFTVFAPTNEAFEAVPPDVLDAVLADQELLTAVLTYHVVGGESLDAEMLGDEGTAASVQGDELSFGDDGTTVDEVDVICSDVAVSNGTVHIIDEVLLPQVAQDAIAEMTGQPAAQPTGANGAACEAVPTDGEGSFSGMADDTAATAASNNPLLSTLVTAVGEAGLVDTLNSDGPFTIFAPTNDAFGALPPEQLEAALADTELLTEILTLHVISGEQLSSADLVDAGTATTVNGEELSFESADGAVSVNGSATTICQDVATSNATVHIIDSVLLPSS